VHRKGKKKGRPERRRNDVTVFPALELITLAWLTRFLGNRSKKVCLRKKIFAKAGRKRGFRRKLD